MPLKGSLAINQGNHSPKCDRLGPAPCNSPGHEWIEESPDVVAPTFERVETAISCWDYDETVDGRNPASVDG